MLYPLVFHPIFKQHPWGGRNLERLYRKQLPPDATVGESWEISDRDEGRSVIANGPLAGHDLHWLMEHHGTELMGRARPCRGRFPLLVKLLDAAQAPSVQVHPGPEAAERLGGESKTEFWYVAYAAPGARLHLGLMPGVKRLQFERKIADGSVTDCLHTLPVQDGDAVLVPGGRVHTIGPGNVVFEIQENSDTTYRVYDWNRPGPDGNPRELHVDKAMAAIDFDDFEPALVPREFQDRPGARIRKLAETQVFTIDEHQVLANYELRFGESDRPSIICVVAGTLRIRHAASGTDLTLAPGQFCLVPASINDAILGAEAQSTFLLVQAGVETPLSSESATHSERTIVPAWQAYESRRKMQDALAGPAQPRRWQQFKRRLTKRLTYSPFLRMLVLKFWFRTAVLLLLLIGLAMAILLPPVWRTSPPDFLPVIKVSLLDRLQARMLRRTAERATADKRFRDAAEAWRAAFGNDMASPPIARGLIRNTLEQDELDRAELRSAFHTVPWLLRLTRTNQSDLELCVKFLDKFQMHDQVYELLAPMTNGLTPPLEVAMAKATFFESRFTEFSRCWEKLSPQQKEDPELALCHAAFLATWGPHETSGAGRQRLLDAANGPPPLRNLANRILMSVAVSRSDVATFEAAFRRLEESRAATGLNHAAYWMLLASAGRKDEAIKLARDYAYPPRSTREVARMATAYATLGLTEEAQSFLQRYATAFGTNEEIWQIYASVALAAEDWERLRAVALQMRSMPTLAPRLRALSFYYEGRADLATGRKAAALLAFKEAAEADFPSPFQANSIARTLINLGFPGPARSILDKTESTFASQPDYWEMLVSLAMVLKDEELLLKASREALRLSPTSPVMANRYAAALIIVGNRPSEAITLTTKLYRELPASIAVQINHSLALLMNYRTEEAAALLDRILPSRLDSEELNSYKLASFHLAVQQRRFAQARELLSQIEPTRLFPAEQRWIDEARAKISQP